MKTRSLLASLFTVARRRHEQEHHHYIADGESVFPIEAINEIPTPYENLH